jgi:tetratricopeptide (TPR) repeat protein
MGKWAESVPYYEKAFALEPGMLTSGFVAHEYGFTLVHLGRVADARAVFDKMIAEQDRVKQAAGLRSMGLLETFQGRYTAATEYFARAAMLSQTLRAPLSEFRNRMYLANAYRMVGRDADASAQAAAAARLASTNRFDPSWLLILGTFQLREGRLGDARALLARASDTANDAVAASGINRSTTADQSNIDLLKGEIDLAAGRAAEAFDLFDASLRTWPKQTVIMERVARALVRLNRLSEAKGKYEAILAMKEFGFEAQQPWFLAHLELGKICEREGDTAKAREYYQQLIDLWKDGDATLRPLMEAKERLKKLS